MEDQRGPVIAAQRIEKSPVVEAPFHQGKPDGTLWIRIQQEHSPAAPRQRVGEVDGDGGFAHSTFLAGDADLGHWGAIYGVAWRGCNREMRVRAFRWLVFSLMIKED